MKVIDIPIEPIDMRYTAQWAEWSAKELPTWACVDYYQQLNPGQMVEGIKRGEFLDVVGTHYYKARQIQSIAWLVNNQTITPDDHVVFFVQDGWFPIEQLAYMRDALNAQYWKFIGVFHDGTYDKWDLTARTHMYVWGEELERSWMKIYDRIIVGSFYHKSVLVETRGANPEKINVLCWPLLIDVEKYRSEHKEPIVVWPHRLAPEKRHDTWQRVVEQCTRNMMPCKFMATQESKLPKENYYQLLGKSRVALSTAQLEMFGIGMMEATVLGCIPLVPDALAYRDYYLSAFRYKSYAEMVDKLQQFIDHPEQIAMSRDLMAHSFIRHSREFYTKLVEIFREV